VGDTPFDGSTHFEIMTKHLTEPPRRPSRLGAADVPQVVEDAVMRSLAKRPEDRFPTARAMRKQLEAALRAAGIPLADTQKLDRGVLGDLRAAVANPAAVAPTLPSDAGPRHATARGGDEFDTGAVRARRVAPWIAIAIAVLAGGGVAALVIQRAPRFRPSVEIAGVALLKGATIGKLAVETDGSVEPRELARRYTKVLDELRVFAAGEPRKIDIPDAVDVLLAVPASALCEPTAYFEHKAPADCASALYSITVGARGARRLMVVSDGARLDTALRRGVAQAACEFSPDDANKGFREICAVTGRFAESAN
jgi:hypothetical protein